MADAFVGNDSGMTHLAGMLHIPSIVLTAQIKGKNLYGIYPTIKVIDAPLSCGGCHWQSSGGWVPRCDQLCANLQMIQPQDVFLTLQNVVKPLPGLLDDPGADRRLNAMIARLQAPFPNRRSTLTMFLNLLKNIPTTSNQPLKVVETGCQRSHDDYGAGMSTTILGYFLKNYGGKLLSIDNDSTNVVFARQITSSLSLPVEVIQADSRKWLTSSIQGPIDGVYLDSADTWTPNYQECCLEEAKLASLVTNTILIDDTYKIDDTRWDGKGAKAVPWLLSQGWEVVKQGYQTLLSK